MGKTSYRLFIIAFFAILAGSAFSLARPVQVWAAEYSGDVNTSDFNFSPTTEITITGNTNLHIDSSVTVHSITINDNCTLTITGDPGKTLTSTSIIDQAGDSGNLTVTSGTIVCETSVIDVNDLIINGGIIDVKNQSDAFVAIHANNITINGGTVTAPGKDDGITADTISISGKNTVVNATGADCYGIHALYDINISGGKVTATGKKSGIFSVYEDVTISGINTVVNATSNDENGIETKSVHDVKISGGKVTANGKLNGIKAYHDLTISGSNTVVNATGTDNNGILADNILSISGGKVTAQGNWCGIATENGDMTISGSNTVVNAKAADGPAVSVSNNGLLNVAPPLTVTKPAGGGIDPSGKYIAKVAGGHDYAKDVVIKGPVAKSDAGSDSDDESESEKPAVVNKDAIAILKITGFPYGTFFAKQEQGLAAKAAFAASLPAGYKSAFSFNAITNGKSPDNTLKKGSFTLVIPAEFRKAGRTFAITYLDKNGKATTLYDTDNDPNTITVAVNFEGYAFELIYKD